MFRWLNATVLSASLCAAGASAQPQLPKGEELVRGEEARQRAWILRAEAEVKIAFDDAARMEKISSIKAVNRLIQARIPLENDVVLPEKARKELIARIGERIRAIETGTPTASAPANPSKDPAKRAELARAEALVAERDALKKGIDDIAGLVRAGKDEQARKEAEALQKKFPDNPAAQAFGENLNLADKIVSSKAVLARMDDGYRAALIALGKSATPIKDDIEYDREHFKRITKLRKTDGLTSKEREIIKSLDLPIELKYTQMTFADIMKDLSAKMKVPILLDEASIKTAEVDASATLLNIELPKLATRTALRKILQDRGLSYIVRNETIQVMTLEKAREQMITKVYYIGDLVAGNGPYGGAAFYGPALGMEQTISNANTIVKMIRDKVDPTSWREGGGSGSITFHYPSLSIIVRQSAEVHALMGNR